MIIEGDYGQHIMVDKDFKYGNDLLVVRQTGDVIVVAIEQAAQLIEVLQRWVNGEEIECYAFNQWMKSGVVNKE